MNIGEILKAGRIAKGFTLRQVEKKTSISNSYLSQLENGKITSPSADKLSSLCELYELSVFEVLGLKSKKVTQDNGELNVYFSLLTEKEKEEVMKFIKFTISNREIATS